MSTRGALRLCFAAFAATLVLSNAGDQAFAEKQLAGATTVWSTTGKLQFGGSGVQNETVDANGRLAFGPLVVPAVVGDFAMSITYVGGIGDGLIEFAGTYALVKPGKPTFLIDPFSLQSQFDAFITDATLKAKLKTSKGVDTVEAELKIRFEDCTFDSKGKVKCTKPNLSYKGKGGVEPPA